MERHPIVNDRGTALRHVAGNINALKNLTASQRNPFNSSERRWISVIAARIRSQSSGIGYIAQAR